MNAQPEARARQQIDQQLGAAGWLVQDRAAANTAAGHGVAIREFPLKGGPVDYLLYVDGAAVGAIEAKKEGWTLTGVEGQSKRYSEGLPDALPAYRRPLPFLYESTGVETQFTNLLDPEPRSREASPFIGRRRIASGSSRPVTSRAGEPSPALLSHPHRTLKATR